MPLSLVILSARSISWIWNSTESRFSNTRDRCSPTCTRRGRFSSMTRLRKRCRIVSYSPIGRTSLRSIGRMLAPLIRLRGPVAEAVGRGERLDGVEHVRAVLLEHAKSGERAVAHHDVGL